MKPKQVHKALFRRGFCGVCGMDMKYIFHDVKYPLCSDCKYAIDRIHEEDLAPKIYRLYNNTWERNHIRKENEIK